MNYFVRFMHLQQVKRYKDDHKRRASGIEMSLHGYHGKHGLDTQL